MTPRAIVVLALLLAPVGAALAQPEPPYGARPLPRAAPPPPPPYGEPPAPPEAPATGLHYLGFKGGASIPLSNVDLGAIGGGHDTNGDPGPLFGIDYLYQGGEHFGFGGEIDYLHRSASRSLDLVPSAETNVSGNTWLFLVDGRYVFTTGRRARPYILLGIGAHRTSTTIDATPLPGFSWSDTLTDETRELVDDHRWGFASSLRFGIDFSQASPTVLGFEIGWTRLDTAKYRATPDGQALGLDAVTGPIHFLTLTGHMRFGW